MSDFTSSLWLNFHHKLSDQNGVPAKGSNNSRDLIDIRSDFFLANGGFQSEHDSWSINRIVTVRPFKDYGVKLMAHYNRCFNTNCVFVCYFLFTSNMSRCLCLSTKYYYLGKYFIINVSLVSFCFLNCICKCILFWGNVNL